MKSRKEQSKKRYHLVGAWKPNNALDTCKVYNWHYLDHVSFKSAASR